MSTYTYTHTTYTHILTFTYTDLVSEDEVKGFFAESLIMKDFIHAHILGLLGVCFDSPDFSPYIVLPFMANGNMKDYLKSKRVHVIDVDTYPEVCEKHNQACQTARLATSAVAIATTLNMLWL